jgi:hypothetical protein
MAGTPFARVRAPGALSVFALGLVLIFVSVACAAMAPAAAAPVHPCCPNSGHASSDHCEKTGCISTVPVLLPAPIGDGSDVPVVVQTEFLPLIESSAPEPISVTGFGSCQPEQFLKIHQLLI